MKSAVVTAPGWFTVTPCRSFGTYGACPVLAHLDHLTGGVGDFYVVLHSAALLCAPESGAASVTVVVGS